MVPHSVQGPFVFGQDKTCWHTFFPKNFQQNLQHREYRILADLDSASKGGSWSQTSPHQTRRNLVFSGFGHNIAPDHLEPRSRTPRLVIKKRKLLKIVFYTFYRFCRIQLGKTPLFNFSVFLNSQPIKQFVNGFV